MSRILCLGISQSELQLHRLDQALLLLQQVLTDATREIAKLGDLERDMSEGDERVDSVLQESSSLPNSGPGDSQQPRESDGSEPPPLVSWISGLFPQANGNDGVPTWLLYLRKLAGKESGRSIMRERDDVWALEDLLRIWSSVDWIECFALPALEIGQRAGSPPPQGGHDMLPKDSGCLEEQEAQAANRLDRWQLQAAVEQVEALRGSISRCAGGLTTDLVLPAITAAQSLVETAGLMVDSDLHLCARKALQDIWSVDDIEIITLDQLHRLLLQVTVLDMAASLLPHIKQDLEDGRLIPASELHVPELQDMDSLLVYLRAVRESPTEASTNRLKNPISAVFQPDSPTRQKPGTDSPRVSAYMNRLKNALNPHWMEPCPIDACSDALAAFQYPGAPEVSREAIHPAMVRKALEGAKHILMAFKGNNKCMFSYDRLSMLQCKIKRGYDSGIVQIEATQLSAPSLSSGISTPVKDFTSIKETPPALPFSQSPPNMPATPALQQRSSTEEKSEDLQVPREPVSACPVAVTAEQPLLVPETEEEAMDEAPGTFGEMRGNIDNRLLEALVESANQELEAMWLQRRELEAQNSRLAMEVEMAIEEASLAESTADTLRTAIEEKDLIITNTSSALAQLKAALKSTDQQPHHGGVGGYVPGLFSLLGSPMLRVVLQAAVSVICETLVPHVRDLIAEEKLPSAPLESLNDIGQKGSCSALLMYLDQLLLLPGAKTSLVQRLGRSLIESEAADVGVVKQCQAALMAAHPESDWKPSVPQTAAWLGAFATLLGAFDLSGHCAAASTQLSLWKEALESNPDGRLQLTMRMSEKRILNQRRRSLTDSAYMGSPEAIDEFLIPVLPKQKAIPEAQVANEGQPTQHQQIIKDRRNRLDSEREIQLLESLLESANREMLAMWEKQRELEARNKTMEAELRTADEMMALAQDAVLGKQPEDAPCEIRAVPTPHSVASGPCASTAGAASASVEVEAELHPADEMMSLADDAVLGKQPEDAPCEIRAVPGFSGLFRAVPGYSGLFRALPTLHSVASGPCASITAAAPVSVEMEAEMMALTQDAVLSEQPEDAPCELRAVLTPHSVASSPCASTTGAASASVEMEAELRTADEMMAFAQDAVLGKQPEDAPCEIRAVPTPPSVASGPCASTTGAASASIGWATRPGSVGVAPCMERNQSRACSSPCARENVKGLAMMQQQNLAAAQGCFERALQHEGQGNFSSDSLTACRNLANTMWQRGNLNSAMEQYKKVLGMESQEFGAGDSACLTTRLSIANLRSDMGDPQTAAALLKDVIKEQEQRPRPDHIVTLAAKCSLAGALWQLGDKEDALASYQELMPQMEAAVGPDHSLVMATKGNLARALRDQGKLAEAGVRLEELYEIQVLVLGIDHPDSLLSAANRAALLADTGGYHGAAMMYRTVLDRQIEALGENHPSVIATKSSLEQTLVLLNGDHHQ